MHHPHEIPPFAKTCQLKKRQGSYWCSLLWKSHIKNVTFLGLKLTSECFAFFPPPWVCVILARWSLISGMWKNWDFPGKAPNGVNLLPVVSYGQDWILTRKTRNSLPASWLVFYMDQMHFHPELQWQIFLALLIDFMLWCTKLAFDGYWDPSPLWAFQLWHLEVLLGKPLTIWASSRLSTCTTGVPWPLPAVSHHSPAAVPSRFSTSACQQLLWQQPG